MGVIISIGLLIFISVYVFYCYVNYRIVAKFKPDINFFENLMPFWNTYILAREVMSRPKLYILLQCLLIAVGLLTMLKITNFSFPTQQAMAQLENYAWFFDLLKITGAILGAYLWGEVARALGKNCWLHRILAVLNVPLIITIPIMAFDKSRPVKTDNL